MSIDELRAAHESAREARIAAEQAETEAVTALRLAEVEENNQRMAEMEAAAQTHLDLTRPPREAASDE